MKQKQKQNKRLVTGSIIAFIIIALIYSFTGGESQDPKEARAQRIEKMFSPVNGEHKQLTEFIKSRMVNPGAYDHVETNFWDMDTAIIVNQKFTRKNELGEAVPGFIKASVDSLGNIRFILEER